MVASQSTVLLDAGSKVTHTYGDDKTYTVVLTVTDDDGGVDVDDTPPLPTTNEDPVPQILLPYCIFVEGTHPCDAIGEFTDPGWLDTHTAVWDFGDGTNATSFHPNANGTYPVQITVLINHAFPGSGTYVVVLTVEDDDGGVGTASVTVVIP
jgi:hypothetical protein